MWPLVAVLALWPVVGLASGKPLAFPSITDKAFIEECVRIHNELRTQVQPPASNMLYMTWDATLAKIANACAKRCVFKHNIHLWKKHQCHPTFTFLGENIWVGNRQAFVVADAIKSWYNEVNFYNFSEHKCTKVCGHYLQVVWDNSHKIGCAVTDCKEVSGIRNAANFVCNYSPSGNFSRRPYKEGQACGNCSQGDTCENKLCRNPERDKIIYHLRWHPPWDIDYLCNGACVCVIVLRLLLLFLTFVAIHFIQKCFKNMVMDT
ncbi:GRPL2 protein, partial [Upupa epops]|nr:GRPL2 protein [Upupa epops]